MENISWEYSDNGAAVFFYARGYADNFPFFDITYRGNSTEKNTAYQVVNKLGAVKKCR